MLNQLRSAVNLAQAIQADVDRITKPTRTRPYRAYTFTSPTYGWIPELTVAAGVRRQDRQSFTPSRSTYNRFVRLANSGNYAVEILDCDHGVAWQLRRKSA